jgi:hypothetical protein
MIDSYTTWFAKCVPCDWRGPMRYSEFAAAEDDRQHQELRHGDDAV